MTLTLALRNLPSSEEQFEYCKTNPLHIAGNLMLDSAGARLFGWDDDELSVLLADTEACTAVRAVLPPPGEYLGGALLYAWVRESPGGAELHSVYRILLGNLEHDPPSKWGPEIVVRDIPAKYEYRRYRE